MDERTIKVFSTYYLIDGIADGEYGPDAETEEENIDVRATWDDLLDGDSSVHLAAAKLLDLGLTEDNGDGSFYLPDGSWVANYRTGQECSQSGHLYGFTDNDQALVSELVAMGGAS